MEQHYRVQIFSHGNGSHEYAIDAEYPTQAVTMAKTRAKEAWPFADSHELSSIWESIPVNARGELINRN